LGRLDNLTVTMLGDLKYGRTVHSLARLLSQFSNIKLNYVSPDILKMAKEVMDELIEGYHLALNQRTIEKYNF